MSQEIVGTPSAGSRGDFLRDAHGKINRNFAELYGDLASHLADAANPHRTTAAQVGAVPLTALGVGVATLDQDGRLSEDQAPAIAFTGDATGAGFARIALTLANTGVAPGAYSRVTVDAKGRVTAASQQNIVVTGDATGFGPASSPVALTLANTGVAPGSYRSVVVDAKGRVLTGAPATASEGLQETTDRGSTTTNAVAITNSDPVAALSVVGGASLGGALIVAGGGAALATGALRLAFPGQSVADPNDPGWSLLTAADTDLVVRSGGGSAPVAARFEAGGNVILPGTLIVNGALVVNGTTTTVNSASVSLDDPTLFLGGDTPPTARDAMDRGVAFRWHDGTGPKLGFFGFDGAAGDFKFVPDAAEVTPNVFSGTGGTLRASVSGNAATADRWSQPRTLALTGAVTGEALLDGSTDVSLTTVFQRGPLAATYDRIEVTANGFVSSGSLRRFVGRDGVTVVETPFDVTVSLPASGVAEGTFRRVTVNPLGLVTAGDNPALTAQEVTDALGFVPVNRAGDTMSGDLAVQAAGGAAVRIASGPGRVRALRFATGATGTRFEVAADDSPETGGNAGSDFRVNRFDDGGVYLSTPLSISRATGVVRVGTLLADSLSAAGIDAATLDGLDSLDFARRAGVAGTLADFGAILPQSGLYHLERGSAANLDSPTGAFSEHLIHLSGFGGARGAQLVVSEGATDQNRFHLRTLNPLASASPTWGAWMEIWHEGRIGATAAPPGFVARTAPGTFASRAIAAGPGILVENGNGATGNPTVSIAPVGSAGTYRQVSVNAFGQVVGGLAPTNETFTLAGDASGTGAPGSLVAVTLAATGVVPGTYSLLVVDAKGRATAGSNPGFLAAESDTLASVTARGASTSVGVSLTGGGIALDATGGVVRAGGIIVRGNPTEGGQIVLGWRNQNPAWQQDATWNIDSDSQDRFRVFGLTAGGSTVVGLTVSPTTGFVGVGHLATVSTDTVIDARGTASAAPLAGRLTNQSGAVGAAANWSAATGLSGAFGLFGVTNRAGGVADLVIGTGPAVRRVLHESDAHSFRRANTGEPGSSDEMALLSGGGDLALRGATNATSPTTGALVTAGGAGVALDLHVGGTIYGAYTAVYADLAERYAASEPLAPGDVVEIGGEAEVRRARGDATEEVFGVVSTHPAVRLNDAAGDDRTHPYIALAGRVPCRCVGPVRKGQRLVSSGSEPGVARGFRAGDPAFAVFGRALSALAEGEAGLVEAALAGGR